MSEYSEWIYSEMPGTPWPNLSDDIQVRYSWSDVYLSPADQSHDSVCVTVDAAGDDIHPDATPYQRKRAQNWTEAAVFTPDDVSPRYSELRRDQLDALLMTSKSGDGDVYVRGFDLGAYDLFRYSFLWLVQHLGRTRDLVLRRDWPLESFASKICTELAEASSVVTEEYLAYLAKHPDEMIAVHPRKFEAIVAAVLREIGYDVEVTPSSWDGGKDIIALARSGERPLVTLVECKRYGSKRSVGIRHVRELFGVVTHEKADRGLLVTSSSYTKSAVQMVASHSTLALVSGSELTAWLTAIADWRLGYVDGLLQDPRVAAQIDSAVERKYRSASVCDHSEHSSG
jgi:hypothetical protein